MNTIVVLVHIKHILNQVLAFYILCCRLHSVFSFVHSLLYILHSILQSVLRMSYILHPKSSIPHLKSMHWGKHSVQHSTLCIIHSTSYIATYILFPDVQHSAMSFVLHSKYSLLNVRCISYNPLYLRSYSTSYILHLTFCFTLPTLWHTSWVRHRWKESFISYPLRSFYMS